MTPIFFFLGNRGKACLRGSLYPALLIFVILFGISPAFGKSPGQDLLDEGVSLYQKERYQEALSRFKRATELDPGLLKGWENIGWAYYKLDRKEEAVRIWETLLKIEPGNLHLLNEIGFIHLSGEAWEKAVVSLRKSLQVEPNQPKTRLRLGEAYQALGRWEKAAREYETALRLRPGDLTAILRRMALYEKRDQELEAIGFLEEKFSETSSPLFRFHLGRLQARRGDRAYRSGAYSEAEAAYQTALRWDPDNPQYRINLGWTKRKQGSTAAAIAEWREALDRDPDPSRLYRPLADAYLELGDRAEARAWYERGWGSGRREPEAAYHLAEIALQENQRERAIQRFSDLSTLPEWDETWALRVANLFIALDQPEEGVSFFTQRKTGDPGRGKALGRLYAYQGGKSFQAGEVEKATQHYLAALRFDNQNMQALRDLGWSYWKRAQWDRSEEIWKRYRAVYPDRPEPYNLLTQIYLYKRDYRAAIDSIEASLALSPDQPDERLKRAKARFWDGRFDTGRREAEQLATLYPDHLPIQTFWGELLMQYHDFKRGKGQWRKVLDLGSVSPKAEYFWLRSMYESGEYEKAVAEAKKRAGEHPPKQAILRFLAEDALFREDKEEAVRWYRLLTEAFPQHPSFWLERSRLYQEMNLFPESLKTLEQARQAHPDHLEIRLSLTEAERLNGKYDAAERRYIELTEEYPDNRRAYIGLLQTRIEARRFREALALLEQNRSAFLKGYEVDLQRGAIYAGMGAPGDAESSFMRVASPAGTTRYIPILLYHGLSDHPRSMNLSVDLFDAQLQALGAAGYQTITIRELGRMVDGKEPFPPKPILITFDDARIDAFLLGDPILAKHGMKATMFVPTAKITDQNPFFADWEMIRKYAGTGRWDLQSHGDHAHDLIPIDAAEQIGGFLVNRLWIKEQERLETREEYLQRLEIDYRQSRRLLDREVAGLDLIGYAFPFSEAGQENIGNEPRAAEFNEQLLAKYFRFGFVQDQNGYNAIEPGPAPAGRMLRRFSVPRSWDGKKLLAHLTAHHPGLAATIRIGQSYYWSGRYDTARALFERLPAEAPLLKGDSAYYLAALSYQQGRYREAARHFSLSLAEGSERAGNSASLLRQIAWQNQAQTGIRFGLFHDSNDRSNRWQSLLFRYPLAHPIDLSFEIGRISFRENGFSPLSGQELRVGARWQTSAQILLEGSVRARFLEGGDDTGNLWLTGKYQADHQEIHLRWAYEDVETLQAHRIGLQTRNGGFRYRLRLTSQWRGDVDFLYRSYEDGNERTDFRTGLSYQLLAWPGWRVGAAFTRSDTRFQSDRYYTPAGLNVGRATLSYRKAWDSGTLLEGEGGIGLAEDTLRGTRWVGYGEIKSVQAWTDQIRSSLAWDYNRSPGYRSWTVEAMAHYRF